MTRRPLPWWASALLVVVAIVLVLSPGQGRQSESWGSRVLGPVQLGVSGFFDQIADFIATFRNVDELADQNRELREQVARLESELVRQGELEKENQDLRNLLGLKQSNPEIETLLAVQVIGRDPSPFIQSITIDLGTNDGVQNDMVVITWKGLVGRITQANPSTSTVLLMTDVNSSVSARIQDPASRATGVIRGTGDGRLLMQHIPQQDLLQEEQLVITSGLGGIYTEGLVVGKILLVQRKDVDVFQEALVEPAVDVSKLEQLYVVASAPGAQEP